MTRAEVLQMLTFPIGGNPIASAARQWIAEREVGLDHHDEAMAECLAYQMDEANAAAYLDLAYAGGAEAFVMDFA